MFVPLSAVGLYCFDDDALALSHFRDRVRRHAEASGAALPKAPVDDALVRQRSSASASALAVPRSPSRDPPRPSNLIIPPRPGGITPITSGGGGGGGGGDGGGGRASLANLTPTSATTPIAVAPHTPTPTAAAATAPMVPPETPPVAGQAGAHRREAAAATAAALETMFTPTTPNTPPIHIPHTAVPAFGGAFPPALDAGGVEGEANAGYGPLGVCRLRLF